MSFVRFTDTDGQHVYLAARFITRVRVPLPGRFKDNARTVISMGAQDQAVLETIEEVLQLLEGEIIDDLSAVVRRATDA